MPLYTPHGLKIRLDPEAVADVIAPLAACHDMNDVLLDVELWENLPQGFATLSASATALLTRSAAFTVGIGLAAYAVGSFVRGFTYSDFLRRLFPMFLGSWIITLVHTIAIGSYLVSQGGYFTSAVLCVMNAFAHLGALEFLQFPLMPIRLPLRRVLRRLPTHQEEVFVEICNRRAAQQGITLDWNNYAGRFVRQEVQ